MEAFGIIGMSMGTIWFIFSLAALTMMNKLVKELKKTNVLDEDFKSS